MMRRVDSESETSISRPAKKEFPIDPSPSRDDGLPVIYCLRRLAIKRCGSKGICSIVAAAAFGST